MRNEEEIRDRLQGSRRRVQSNMDTDTAIQHMRFGAALALAWVLEEDGGEEYPL